MSQPSQKSEWVKFINSFGHAFRGLWYVLHTQRNMRVHVLLGVIAILLGIILRISPVEFALIFVAISSVFIAEMFNTAVEALIDLVSPNYHPLAKVAKDVAAGAVLASAIFSICIGLFIFSPHLLALLHR